MKHSIIALIAASALAALSLALAIYGAQAADLGKWFKSLRQPTTGMSCCDISDCRRLSKNDVTIKDGNYWVLNYGRWMVVEEEKVLPVKNEAKAPVLCSSPTTVYCFTPWDTLS